MAATAVREPTWRKGPSMADARWRAQKEKLGKQKVNVLELHNTNNLVQQDLHQGNTSSCSTEAWGNAMGIKGSGICWIGLFNPSGFTIQSGTAKDDSLYQFLHQGDFNVMCFPEVNVNWPAVYMWHRLRECTFSWFKTLHAVAGYNRHEGHKQKTSLRWNSHSQCQCCCKSSDGSSCRLHQIGTLVLDTLSREKRNYYSDCLHLLPLCPFRQHQSTIGLCSTTMFFWQLTWWHWSKICLH